MDFVIELLKGGWYGLVDYLSFHVLTCLIPAFFIAGAIGVFFSQATVLKYFGPKSNKAVSYGVASVSGAVLAVCSCTVLPIFGGIYKRGAGLGPAVAFLYSGPAINILAIIYSARLLGYDIGVARAIGAIVFRDYRDDYGHAREVWPAGNAPYFQHCCQAYPVKKSRKHMQ